LQVTPSLSLNTPSPSQFSPLSLHDALPIYAGALLGVGAKAASVHTVVDHLDPFRGDAEPAPQRSGNLVADSDDPVGGPHQGKLRSEEHTSELQPRGHLVCRLLLEKKKQPAR